MKGSLPRLGRAGLVKVCRSSSTPHPLTLAFTLLLSLLPKSWPGLVSPAETGAAQVTLGLGSARLGSSPLVPKQDWGPVGSHGGRGPERMGDFFQRSPSKR